MMSQARPPRATYMALTRGVKVEVTPRFLPEQSDPARARYAWAYTVRIENVGALALQLVSRRWIITDGRGLDCQWDPAKGPAQQVLLPNLPSAQAEAAYVSETSRPASCRSIAETSPCACLDLTCVPPVGSPLAERAIGSLHEMATA